MIGFECTTEKDCGAYNYAIRSILQGAELKPFHQIGTASTGENNPGYHAWEVWKKTTQEDLEKLFDLIQKRAKKMM